MGSTALLRAAPSCVLIATETASDGTRTNIVLTVSHFGPSGSVATSSLPKQPKSGTSQSPALNSLLGPLEPVQQAQLMSSPLHPEKSSSTVYVPLPLLTFETHSKQPGDW